VGEIYRALKDEGILDKTMIIFIGDNGFFFGEHGLTEKRLAYEESIRVPFLVRYPPMIQAGSVSSVDVLNIDIAPTLLALAGIPVPSEMQGQDLLPVFQGGQLADPRSALLFEFWSETDLPGQSCWWKAVRTDEWKYVHYYKEPFYDELYNLKDDPYEMSNLVKEPRYVDTLKHMQSELVRLMEKYDDKGGDYGFWE